MSTEAWSEHDLAAISDADELNIAAVRTDGSLRPEVIIWAVRVDDGIYIRSANGREAAWYRHTAKTKQAQIRAGGVVADVALEDASDDAELTARIQAEYHRKYDRYGERVTRGALSEQAQGATWRLISRSMI